MKRMGKIVMLLLFLPEKAWKRLRTYRWKGGVVLPLNSWTGVFFFTKVPLQILSPYFLYLKKNKQIISHTHLNPPHTEIMRKEIKLDIIKSLI